MTYQPLKHLQHIFLRHKRHFAIYLGKFRLTISAQVFITETFYNLEIAVKARHHQQLFKGLRRLRQGIKFPGIHPTGDHKIPRAFGRRFNQNRSFHFNKILSVHVQARLLCYFMAQFQIFTYRITAQIKITVFHAEFISTIGLVFNLKRRQFSSIQNRQRRQFYFNISRRHFIIFGKTLSHYPRRLNHKLAA